MKLSILIPMYNAEKYVGNCIESLLRQDLNFDDYEILIMDDGSQDQSITVVENYAKKYPNITLYAHPNTGCYSTRNKLLTKAKGDYIYHLDADDYIVDNSLKPLLDIAVNENLDIIGFKTKETKKLNLFNLNRPIDDGTLNVCTGSEFLENFPDLRHEIWWYFIKRQFIETNALKFTKNEYNADVVFTLKALLNAKQMVYLPKAIHRYVQTGGSLMRSKDLIVKVKRIYYLHMMIMNLSVLINEAELTDNYSRKLIDNLSHRRDVFTFFNLLNMVRNPFHITYIKNKVNSLKEVNAYPIHNFAQKNYDTLKFNLLVTLINKENILYLVIYLKNMLIKPEKTTLTDEA
ncbi:MAG: glycosyltransferase [Winogradskyella sp.]|uniref:glycosyltransferase n=1 Tax=Winogradskyella sp. TaxID=1883156 RepID=UPI0018567927|nr:glycosyltransferase [Winogradskyella sp.]